MTFFGTNGNNIEDFISTNGHDISSTHTGSNVTTCFINYRGEAIALDVFIQEIPGCNDFKRWVLGVNHHVKHLDDLGSIRAHDETQCSGQRGSCAETIQLVDGPVVFDNQRIAAPP
ncbi:MAG: hypothetical protein BWY72_01943 [Bacteroidetes bacterium ADurb.Bin416]|nr:MAG: hypothetical protein BWY72_01943 [Bacteroidetes bacterium ADurb.Bin416]